MLDGQLAKRGALRHTPAGVPAIDFTIVHDSTQNEAGRPRQVRCEVAAVALGTVAAMVDALRPDQPLRVTGFLMQRGNNDGRLLIHIIDVATVQAAG